MNKKKFRIWDRNNNTWCSNKHIITQEGGVEYTTDEGTWDMEDSGFVLQQFTGLKDKNNVDIFEGDIIRDLKTTLDKYKVIFHLGQFQGQSLWNQSVVPFYRYSVHGCNDGGGVVDIRKEIDPEIVGNICENPEMLK